MKKKEKNDFRRTERCRTVKVGGGGVKTHQVYTTRTMGTDRPGPATATSGKSRISHAKRKVFGRKTVATATQ